MNRTVRKYVILLILLLILSMLSGCVATTPDNSDRISRPANNEAPLEGTWVLKKYESGNSEMSSPLDSAYPLIGRNVGFSKDSMAIAGNYFSNVSYKIRRVNANEYFLHKNQVAYKELDLKDDDILIITASSDDKFLYEFIKDPDGMITVSIDDQYYRMEKVSDEFSGNKNTAAGAIKRNDKDETGIKNIVLRSGILLGLRIPVQTEDGLGDYTYGTYWISMADNSLRPVLYAENIYLPRMDGFWKLQVDKRLGSEGIEDYIFASMVSKTGSKLRASAAGNSSLRVETRLRKAVVYVGNDYVCVENTYYNKEKDSGKIGSMKVLRTLPVDNLTNIDGIKISDLSGENGTMAMESAISELLKESAANGMKSADRANQGKNFALYRKTGHWFFKGRLNLSDEDTLPYVDFNLNLIPPANMVAYDMLQVPWKEMKDKLPQALDIFTSPNKDMAIIIMRNNILIYGIENKALTDEPLARLPMVEGSSVIMAEWAMGDYITSWEKSFVNNNETGLVESVQ